MAAIAAALALTLGGCTSGDDDADGAGAGAADATTTTSAPTTTSSTIPRPYTFERLDADPALSPEEQVEAAYLHHWDVVVSAFAHGDDEVLDLVLTGEALQVRRDQLAYLLGQEQRIEGTVEHEVTVEVVSETEARVVDEETSHLVTLDADGEVVNDDAGATTTSEYQLVLQDGAWLVSTALRTG